jgi:hypothetical protein
MPTKQKPTWKSGLHQVYIARDKQENWFKIGMTSKDLEYYRKRLCERVYGRRSQEKIEICCDWLFADFWAAWYIEQTAIELIERMEFARVRPGDWFSIDRPSMAIIVDLIDELALPIRKWEQANFDTALACKPLQFTAWGSALSKAGLKPKFSRRLHPQVLSLR